MIRRIKAVNITVRAGLSIFELVIAFAVVVKFIGGMELFDWMCRNFPHGPPMGNFGNSYAISASKMKGSVTFLFIVLAFMIFGYVLMVAFPLLVKRNERRIRKRY